MGGFYVLDPYTGQKTVEDLEEAIRKSKCAVNFMGRKTISLSEHKLDLSDDTKTVAKIARKYGIKIYYHDLDDEFRGSEAGQLDKSFKILDPFSHIVTGGTVTYRRGAVDTGLRSHYDAEWPLLWKSLYTSRLREAYSAHVVVAGEEDDDGKWTSYAHYPFLLKEAHSAWPAVAMLVYLVRNFPLDKEEQDSIESVAGALDKHFPGWRTLKFR
ncbi:hypothetical protein N657DRAFT_649721 [Parathielavia appendiculata]|uniref:Uncharacterized protein n=1 Tax=Parathielavia appendiculata TaxID=2587402 RepID=A0AAN6TSI4_9PEZI|nr:hypothetical protein N657DRAFT_649721 [Parathielavia appendiculata]